MRGLTDPSGGRRPRLPSSESAVRVRVLGYRVGGLCVTLLGGLALLVGALALAAVPSLIEDEKAFADATPCATASPASAHADCLREVDATVKRTVIRDQPKTAEYTLYLDGPGQVPSEIDMGGAGPLLKRLRPGDKVTVIVWRDYAVEVRRGDVAQTSSDTPVGEPQITCMIGLGLIPVGAFGLYAGGSAVWSARRHSARGRGLPPEFLGWGKTAGAIALCAVAAGAVGAVAGTNVPVMLLVWLVLLVPVWWITGRRWRSDRARRAGLFA
ncbi:hypothetical protein ABZ990_02120 [Streptomyces sp. NPDC046203]|uniref:hypothetical protein n=1 Tax=Streptomyces sp. NPDC046203 TaxID=3154602 RepID=UPI0033FAC32B